MKLARGCMHRFPGGCKLYGTHHMWLVHYELHSVKSLYSCTAVLCRTPVRRNFQAQLLLIPSPAFAQDNGEEQEWTLHPHRVQLNPQHHEDCLHRQVRCSDLLSSSPEILPPGAPSEPCTFVQLNGATAVGSSTRSGRGRASCAPPNC
jgi:hypothetical protein